MSFTNLNQKQRRVFVHIVSFWIEVLQGRHAMRNGDDFDWQVQTQVRGSLLLPDVSTADQHTRFSANKRAVTAVDREGQRCCGRTSAGAVWCMSVSQRGVRYIL